MAPQPARSLRSLYRGIPTTARKLLSGLAALVVLLMWTPLASVTTASATAHTTAHEPVVTQEDGVNGCMGVRTTPGSENTHKRLVGGSLVPGGTATFEISFPVDPDEVGGDFRITDCVFVDGKPLVKYSVDFVPNNEAFLLTFTLDIPSSVGVGSEYCNYAKTTGSPSASPASNRKAGPACFRVGGDIRVVKEDMATNTVLPGATFAVSCTATEAMPPVVISGLTGSSTTSGLTTTHTGVATNGTVAIAGPMDTRCTITETAAPAGYRIASPATQTVVICAEQQMTVTFEDPKTQSDLHIAKSADPVSGSSVTPGSTITYTLSYWNSGDADATGAVITDNLNANLTYVSSTLNGVPSGAVNASNKVTFPAVTVAAGTSEAHPAGTATITARVNDGTPNGTVMKNVGKINGVTSNEVRHTVRYPVLSALKSAAPASGTSVLPGATIDYTIGVTNSGQAAATNVAVTDAVPAGTTYVAGSADAGGSFTGGQVSWTIPTIAAGATATVHFSVTVDSDVPRGTHIRNTAVVGGKDTNTTDHPVTRAELSAAKSAVPADGTSVKPGDSITYGVTVTNAGDAIARSVTVTDAVPAHTTYTAGSIDNGGSVAAGTATWTVDVPANSSVTVHFSVTVDADATNGDVIDNVAVVAGTDTNTVHHPVDFPVIAATKGASPASGTSVKPGDSITYEVAVTNSGDAAATGVTVTDHVPAHTTYTAGSADQGGAESGGTVTWAVDVAPHTTVSVHFSVTVDADATNSDRVRNVAVVNGSDTNPVTHPVDFPVLSAEKSAVPVAGSSVKPGDSITYAITVSNSGDAAATGVAVTDHVPAHTSFVSADSGGSVSGADVSWTVDVAAHSSTTVHLTVVVAGDATDDDTISNVAVVGGTDTNTVDHPVDVPLLSVLKTAVPASGSTVEPGDAIAYSITVTNSGDGAAKDVAVTDTLPAGITVAGGSISDGGTLDNGTITWSLDVAPHSTVTVTFRATVDGGVADGTVLHNVATLGDQTSTTGHPVHVPVAGLGITKTVDRSTAAYGDTLTYGLTVTTTGDRDQTGVVVTDVVPAGTTYVSASCDGACASSYDAGTRTVSWDLGDVAAGSTREVGFVVTIDVPTAAADGSIPGTTITNSGAVSSDQVSTTPSNEVDTVVPPVPGVTPPDAGIALVKTVDHDTAGYGDTLTYGFTAAVTGVDQTSVTVTDVVPDGTTYVAGSATCEGTCTTSYDAGSRTLTWELGSMSAGTTRALGFQVTIDEVAPNEDGSVPATTILNSGLISSDQVGSTPSNEVETGVVAVLPTETTVPPTVEPSDSTSPSATPSDTVSPSLEPSDTVSPTLPIKVEGIKAGRPLPFTGLLLPIGSVLLAAAALLALGLGLVGLARRASDPGGRHQ